MPAVACLMMQKNESDLLLPWIEYHAYLFGVENLFIFDNGSDLSEVNEVLDSFAAKGGNLDRSAMEYDQKGVILGNRIKELDTKQKYDYFIPLDCDEFIVVQEAVDQVSCDRERIHYELSKLDDDRTFNVRDAYFNVLGHKDRYWCWEMGKTFFKKQTFKYLDHGHHNGMSSKAAGKCETRFAYMHFHHKPWETLVLHARNKLVPYVDVDDNEKLAAFQGCGQHLVKYLLQPKEEYMRRFETAAHSVALPEFSKRLEEIGVALPFI